MEEKIIKFTAVIRNGTTFFEALVKNPRLRPIGVGEVLRRIACKIIMRISKNDIMRSLDPSNSVQVKV